MPDPVLPSATVAAATAAIRDSRQLVRTIEAEIEDTCRQLAASRALLENCRRLLEQLEAGTPAADPES